MPDTGHVYLADFGSDDNNCSISTLKILRSKTVWQKLFQTRYFDLVLVVRNGQHNHKILGKLAHHLSANATRRQKHSFLISWFERRMDHKRERSVCSRYPAIAIALKCVCPLLTAETMALLSAQIVPPSLSHVDGFSMNDEKWKYNTGSVFNICTMDYFTILGQ